MMPGMTVGIGPTDVVVAVVVEVGVGSGIIGVLDVSNMMADGE